MKYPELVTRLTTVCNAWIFGGACLQASPRDYDVFVPLPFWRQAVLLVPKNAKINRLGGFKCESEGREVDVWTGEMHDLLASAFFTCAYHPSTDTLIKRIEKGAKL